MTYNTDDTIAGIATAYGNGGISIIRISGNDSIPLIKKIFSNKSEFESHRVYYGYIQDNGTKLDEVLVTIMLAPKTYTVEDVVEINCHGGTKAVQKVLQLVLRNGARLAEPGEFTKRAFLNGRIDLTQAEAVADIINSKTEKAHEQAMNMLDGKLSSLVKQYRDEILLMIANIEASIDYPEHEEETMNYKEVDTKTTIMIDKIKQLLKTYDRGKLIKDGIKTVILGRPNVGKSSLLNALLQEDKAIVTDIAGTTRDALTEYINIHDIVLQMIDTAGIRETSDVIEKIGVQKSKTYAKEAELIFYVVDGSTKLQQEDYEIMELIKDKTVITIVNKNDLQSNVEMDVLQQFSNNIVNLSAMNNTGFDELYDILQQIFFEGNITSSDIYITSVRHKNCLENSISSLNKVRDGLEISMPEDLLVIDLLDCYNYLGEIVGETLDDDIIDKIFSEFCLGK